jgi:aldehyde:ferredoxin oxidoreductase
MDMLARSFYQAMHWDLETGKPDLEHLKELKLDEVVEAFYPQEG